MAGCLGNVVTRSPSYTITMEKGRQGRTQCILSNRCVICADPCIITIMYYNIVYYYIINYNVIILCNMLYYTIIYYTIE